MLQVASRLHTSQIGRVADLFRAADRYNSGTVCQHELLGMLEELGVEREDAEHYASCADIDSNGRIEYAEFVSGCLGLLYESLRDLLWQTFCVLDVDGSGELGREDIKAVVTSAELVQHGFLGNDPDEVVRAALDRMDVDSNGQVSFDELCRHLLPPRPPPSARDAATTATPAPASGIVTGGAPETLRDEEFALLLDEIEADHGAQVSDGPELPAAYIEEPLVQFSEGIAPSSVESDIAPGGDALAVEGDELGSAVPLEAEGGGRNMSVEEELSSLLADIAKGP